MNAQVPHVQSLTYYQSWKTRWSLDSFETLFALMENKHKQVKSPKEREWLMTAITPEDGLTHMPEGKDFVQ